MSKRTRREPTTHDDELTKRLTQVVEAEVVRLAEWSSQREKAHTLGEMEQVVLGVLRRLGPQLLEELVEDEAQNASLSPPVCLPQADGGHRQAAQTDADTDG